jgi:two-component system cell cycle sensor histidine kinase/response regulator CckA
MTAAMTLERAVLVVEDDPHTAELERRALVRAGKRVRITGLVGDAIAAMWEETFAVILLDYRLPDGDPWPVFEAARRMMPPVPVILATSVGDERIAAEVIHRGGADYLIKTNGFWEQLPAIIDRVLKTAGAEQSNARLAALVESSDDAIVSESLRGEILSWNAGAERLFGYSAAEAIGMPMSALTPADRLAEGATILDGIRHGRATRLETVRLHRDGSPVDVSITVSPVFDGAGFVVSAAAILRDITDRKRKDDLLRENEQLLRLALESARMGVWDLDLTTDTTTRSLRHDQIFGYEALQPHWGIEAFNKHVLPEELDGIKLAFEEAMVSGALKFECRIRWPDGSLHWIQAEGCPVADAEGRPVRVIGVLTDITERKAAEEALRKSAELDRALFDGSPLPMLLFDIVSLEILAVNDASLQQYGYSREDLLAMTIEDISRPEDVPALIATRPDSQEEYLRAGVFAHRKKDGTFVRVAVHVHDVWVGERRLRLALLQDVTEQKWLEDQLRQAQKMDAIGRLAGGIAHDFNNILSVINGYSELLLESLDAEAAGRREIAEINKAGHRAAEMTRQLLAFSRKREVARKAINLNSVLQDMGRMLGRLIGEHIELAIHLDPNLGQVQFDASQLEQIILNLAVNARDAIEGAGLLLIETGNRRLEREDLLARGQTQATPGEYVLLKVSDTGSGMDEATLALIFEPFFTTKEPGRGTGLGLSTVFGIVEQCGGVIDVESELGRGTTFRIYLPRVDSPAFAPAPKEQAPRPAHGGETLLLVEDDEQLRSLLALVLQQAGYTVLETASPQEALTYASNSDHRIDLLITDVVMPQMRGPMLAARITEARPAVKVLFLSGYTGKALTAADDLNPQAPFLEKPFARQALLTKVRELLAEPASANAVS